MEAIERSNSVCTCMLSCFTHVWLFVTPWTTAHQVPLSMGFSSQEYWSGLPCSPPGDLLDPGIELSSLMSPVLAGQFFTTSATWEALSNSIYPKLVMYISRLEQLWEFLNDCNLESQLGKSPRPCIHPVGETSHCSFGNYCL